MTIPVQVGLPQIVLFIIGILGLVLLISSGMGLRSRRVGRPKDFEDEQEARKFGKPRPRRHHRRFRWERSIGGLVLLLLAFSLLWLTLLVQTYVGLTSDIKVARVHATAVANMPHLMSLDLTLYDQNGQQTSEQTYIVNGDEWMLQGDIIKFPTWLNILGLHSGYKLTRLEGRYDDRHLELTAPRTVVDLNGGDDNFFKTANTQKSWFSWFVDASYGNAVFQAPGTFDVFATQDALIARPAP